MQEVPERVRAVLDLVARRCWQEPDLDDFLAWRGATLEYWTQMVFATVAGRVTWAARGETPVITACPAPRAKTREKWADGALIWPADGTGVLVEIKAITAGRPARARELVRDLAALAAVGWPATLGRAGPDADVDDRWWADRHHITAPWALTIALVHGPAPIPSVQDWLPVQLGAELDRLTDQHPDGPPWIDRITQALTQPLFTSNWTGSHHAAALLAWLAAPADHPDPTPQHSPSAC